MYGRVEGGGKEPSPNYRNTCSAVTVASAHFLISPIKVRGVINCYLSTCQADSDKTQMTRVIFLLTKTDYISTGDGNPTHDFTCSITEFH